MSFGWRPLLLALLFGGASYASGGGSGLNVILVVNQNSSNSVALGNYYRELRDIPPQNFLRISWGGGNLQWASADFNTVLLNPLLDMVATRGLGEQATYVLLSMDIPYRVIQNGSATTSGQNSTTSALFYGFKPDYPPYPGIPSCSLPDVSSNSYAFSEQIFGETPPNTAPTNSFLAMMLTASNLPTALQIAARAVSSDGTAPKLPFVMGKSSDPFRNVRYLLFDNTLFDFRQWPGASAYQTNIDSPVLLAGPVMGYQNGHAAAMVPANVFASGSMADSLTSYGGALFESTGQMPLLAYLAGGASGSYGTVVEPCNYLQKFPSPQVFFYQARGFSLAEAYYMGLANPYQGVLVGEPLAAPFTRKPQVTWNSLPAGALLSGATNLSVLASGADSSRPIGRLDLFVDGTFFQTVTNIGPAPSNVVSLNIRGFATNYTVPGGASVASVTADLAAICNENKYSSATKVSAFAHGDRIELRGTDLSTPGGQIPVSIGVARGTASLLSTHISVGGSALLDSLARGIRSYSITNAPQVGDYLEFSAVKTTGQTVTIAVTNLAPGTNLMGLAANLFNLVNSHVNLTGAEGLDVEDIVFYEINDPNQHLVEFNLRPRAAGWVASQIAVTLSGSPTFDIQPSGERLLDQSIGDLQPRQQIYVQSGLGAVPITFRLNTAALPDGTHQLRLVAYEGSHVRTQGQATQTVRIQNTPLDAALSVMYGGTNTDVSATLQFAVAASGAAISKLELFSTGGLLTNVTGQSAAAFLVPGSRLGPGLHPFYAVATASTGASYRTPTQLVRLLGPEPDFALQITNPPPVVSWPATAGRAYEILSSTNPAGSFGLRATVTPSNSLGLWTDPGPAEAQRFYRVRTTN